jgi:hypothetical protein
MSEDFLVFSSETIMKTQAKKVTDTLRILMGNAAIGRGIMEAGITAVTSNQETPG